MLEDIKVVVTADTAQAEKQIDKLNDEQIEVKAKLKVTKNPLKKVREEADTLGKRVADIKMNKKAFSPEDIKILKAEIEATALKAKAVYFGEGSKSAKELADRLKEMHKALGESKKQAKETNKIFDNMDIMIGSLKAKIVASIVNTLKQGVVEGAKLAGQLEYAVEKTKTISSESRGVINSEVDRIGKKYGTDYREVSEGLYQVVSAIGDVHKKYSLLETANKLAITGFSSVNESVNGLTTVLNAYNLGIEEADRVANVFVRTQKVGKLTVQEFQQQLYKTVPTAKELGITIEEIGASIALLTAKGSKAEVAQTQMGAFLYEMLDTGSEVNKLFTKLKGQSIETFMKSGGNLEGILKTLKSYSSESGFKVESLFGRKEAKSFWLNTGNDIEGLIKKLKEISSPINELDRNVDNLMSTMEKRVERGSKYWDSLKNSIGNATLEVVASFGDIATGHDKETAARKKMNIEMENSLKTLKELGAKNNKTKEEQEKLNEALKVLEILAPEIAEAYRKWSIEGGNYADVLLLIKQRQIEVNNSFKEMSYKEAKKEKEDLEKQIKRLEEEEIVLGRKNRGFGVQETVTVKQLEGNPTGAEMQRLINKGFSYAGQAQEKVARLKNLREKHEEAEKTVIEKEKEINNFGKDTNEDKTNEIAPKQPVIPGRTLTDNREFKNEQEIENDISEALIKAQRKYKESLEKLNITDFTGKEKLDSSYKIQIEKIKNEGQVEQYKRERNDLQRGILTETDDTKVKEAQDKIDKLSLKIQDLEGQIGISDTENRIDNAKKTEEERKKAEEEAKKEVDKRYKEEELKNKIKFDEMTLEAQEQYWITVNKVDKKMKRIKKNY